MKNHLSFAIFFIIIALIAAPIVSTSTAYAQDDESVCDAIVFVGGWSRPALSLDSTGNGAGYGLLVNLGEEDDVLLSVTSDAANVIELHEVLITEDDVMQMRPMDGGLPIPAGGFAEFRPAGNHIMMIGLTADLVPDNQITLRLEFEHAEPLTMSYDIVIDEPTGEGGILGISGDLTNCPDVGLYGAWARPVLEDEDHTSVYGILLNLSDEDVVLSATSTDIADEAPHFGDSNPDMDMNMMTVDEIVVPANGFTRLADDGLHIGVTALNTDLGIGDSFDLKLIFDNGFEQIIPVVVTAPDIPDMDMGMDHDMHNDEMEMGDDMEMNSE